MGHTLVNPRHDAAPTPNDATPDAIWCESGLRALHSQRRVASLAASAKNRMDERCVQRQHGSGSPHTTGVVGVIVSVTPDTRPPQGEVVHFGAGCTQKKTQRTFKRSISRAPLAAYVQPGLVS